MKRFTLVCLALILGLCASGCGTVSSVVRDDIDSQFGVYSGLQADWELWNRGYFSDDAIVAGYQFMFDMPFSAVADTLLLPISVPRYFVHKNRDDEAAQ